MIVGMLRYSTDNVVMPNQASCLTYIGGITEKFDRAKPAKIDKARQ